MYRISIILYVSRYLSASYRLQSSINLNYLYRVDRLAARQQFPKS